MKFEYWKSAKNNQWYWRLKAGNGEIIAHGEGYVNKADCTSIIDKIKAGAGTATVSEVTG